MIAKTLDCPHVALSNGVPLPLLAFGTWRLPEAPTTIETVRTAIDVAGYRHIDTAAHYGNERSIGEAIRLCSVDRANIFLAGKLSNGQRGLDTAIADCNRALENMRARYFDLYLIHWPAPKKYYSNWAEINAQTWLAFECLYANGKVRSIGVSNFRIHHLEELAKTQVTAPMVLQIKLHPGIYDQQADLIAYCKAHTIAVEAYSPLCAGKILASDELRTIALKYRKSPAQICIRWCLQHDAVPIVKSSSLGRMEANLDVMDFEISGKDMVRLDRLPNVQTELPNPDEVWRD